MPIVGTIDPTPFLQKLGDPSHGLRAAAIRNDQTDQLNDAIFLASTGATECSTETALVRPCEPIWDTNGYYRSLSISWPYRPLRKELREAYISLSGWEDPDLTYVFEQLWDEETRKAYDKTPLGSIFRDRYVLQEEMKLLVDIASEESEKQKRVVTVSELLEGSEPQLLPMGESTWSWGYYLLNSRKYDYTDLIEWQALLVPRLASNGLAFRFAIGYIGSSDEQFLIREHKGQIVFFLNENSTPTPDIAEASVSIFQSMTKGNDDINRNPQTLTS